MTSVAGKSPAKNGITLSGLLLSGRMISFWFSLVLSDKKGFLCSYKSQETKLQNPYCLFELARENHTDSSWIQINK